MIKRNSKQTPSSSSDSGFTIIESILGLLVAAILLAAISPILVISTATRVQSRRIEKATQVANTFIDGVRTGSIKAPSEYSSDNKIELDAATKDAPRTLSQSLITLTTMPVPTTSTKTNLYLFRKDGSICHVSETGCTTDSNNAFEEYYIQARQIMVKSSGSSDGYRLAMRVYRTDVDFDKPLLASESPNKRSVSPVTGGLGNKQAPLVERTADIGNISTSFQALCQRLGIAPDKDGKAQNCQ
ncbi:hormogonium polysaccharide secretion pseudopilin HpsB [Aliinostoc sp. HNIBRCY26]|uniref:hormogonium polysaccharide secretion pseudopilin HpsB n=1 Tax=Aliinostoc sp. HNIBRCY26 TaxID=3418997 RepID=UPI003D079FAC